MFLALPVQYFAKLQRIEIKMEHFGLLVAVYQQQNNFQTINRSPLEIRPLRSCF